MWTLKWQELPSEYQHAFLGHDITDDPVDGRLYARLWKRQEQGYDTPILHLAKDIHRNLSQQNLNEPYIPPDREAMTHIWTNLAAMHEAMTESTVYGDSFYQMERWLRNPPSKEAYAEPEAAQTAYKKYKTWKPRDTKIYDYTTQQAIDKNLLDQWTERLLRDIRPYGLPYMNNNPEPHQQRRLLGKTKWTTIRGHTLTLEKTLKLQPDVLRWQNDSKGNRTVHDLLDLCKRKNLTASRLGRMWTTINWLCRKMGYPAPGD